MAKLEEAPTTMSAPAAPAPPEPVAWQQASMDRDLGWLEFNRRVLAEAMDERTPLLERLKFLAIFTSNLDEFFMKRVGLLRLRGFVQRLEQVRTVVLDLLAHQARCFEQELVPALAAHGIRLLGWNDLDPRERTFCDEYFDTNVSAALTPLSLDPAHPFPFLSNLSTSWGFVLRHPDEPERLFVRVKIPSFLPQWVPVTEVAAEHRYVSLHDIIRHNAHKLFPGMRIANATLFRVSRNAEIELDDEDIAAVDEMVEEQLRKRKFAPVVRLELAAGANNWTRKLLIHHFELQESDVYELPALLDYTSLYAIAGLDIPALRDPPWLPSVPPSLAGEDLSIFDLIRAGDLLFHHPYDSFDATVESFIDSAAEDPKVVAIKMTVYRVGDDTPFVRSLIRAAESGKQVACIIEVKARFDEARNLHWGEQLEDAGVHVVYGVMGLKTHTKIALVVRQELGGLKCYAHIGTGNYHTKTARIYTDVSLLTDDRALTGDVVNLFHYLTGRGIKPRFEQLLVAPVGMRERFIAMIDREIAHHRAGRRAHIIAKMNQLEDPAMCQKLVDASCAGVPVDLIVRGFSTLRAGVPGVTDNIRIRSVIGRFLEHSRIYYFANGETNPLKGEFYIGSADWMVRNLSARVEVVAPIDIKAHRERLWEIFEVMLADQRQAWQMQPDGSYVQLRPPPDATGPALLGTHRTLMELMRRSLEDRTD